MADAPRLSYPYSVKGTSAARETEMNDWRSQTSYPGASGFRKLPDRVLVLYPQALGGALLTVTLESNPDKPATWDEGYVFTGIETALEQMRAWGGYDDYDERGLCHVCFELQCECYDELWQPDGWIKHHCADGKVERRRYENGRLTAEWFDVGLHEPKNHSGKRVRSWAKE